MSTSRVKERWQVGHAGTSRQYKDKRWRSHRGAFVGTSAGWAKPTEAAALGARYPRPQTPSTTTQEHTKLAAPALSAMPTLSPTAASAADADRAALHTTASGAPNEHVSRLRQWFCSCASTTITPAAERIKWYGKQTNCCIGSTERLQHADQLALLAPGRNRSPLDAFYSPPPIALCSAAPLRPSRAARRRDGCRGGDCVIVCVCIVLHRLRVDVLNVPSRAQRASAGSPIGHVMAASKSIALAQFVEEAAAIIIAHCHQCQSTCWTSPLSVTTSCLSSTGGWPIQPVRVYVGLK